MAMYSNPISDDEKGRIIVASSSVIVIALTFHKVKHFVKVNPEFLDGNRQTGHRGITIKDSTGVLASWRKYYQNIPTTPT